MERSWILRLAPPVAAIAAVGALAATSSGAGGGPWKPPSCDGGPERLAAAAKAPGDARDGAGDAWYRLEPRLDADGALEGQRLQIEATGQHPVALQLPPETAAAGPFGTLVVVAADDGRRSAVTAVDLEARCAWDLGESDSVVRRAALSPAGDAVYEFRVDRADRRDLGVWRRALDGGDARRVLPPPPDDPARGVTWTTTLTWSADQQSLVVQSCGALECISRIVDAATGEVTAVDGPGQGELIGLVDGVLVTHAACTGLPCPVLGTNVRTGRSRTIVDVAGVARLVETAGGPRVVAETHQGEIASHRLDGTRDASVPVVDPSLRLVPSADRAAGSMRLPPGSVLLSPDGRPRSGAVITHVPDGVVSVQAPEVLP